MLDADTMLKTQRDSLAFLILNHKSVKLALLSPATQRMFLYSDVHNRAGIL